MSNVKNLKDRLFTGPIVLLNPKKIRGRFVWQKRILNGESIETPIKDYAFRNHPFIVKVENLLSSNGSWFKKRLVWVDLVKMESFSNPQFPHVVNSRTSISLAKPVGSIAHKLNSNSKAKLPLL
jgi:hypothetical protein